MSAPRTLVSGGTGLVGRFIVERLLDTGHDVAVLGRTAPAAGLFSRPVAYVEGTLDPERYSRAAFAGIDHFVHAAFDHQPGRYRGGEGDDPAGFRRRNHEGSLALFEAAREAGVRRAIFLSSRAVYGTQPRGAVLVEDTPPHPDTLYGEVKWATEGALRALRRDGFDAVSLRATGVYGEGRAHKWEALFRDYLAGHPIEPRVATEVHGQDLAEAVRLMLEMPGPADLYNLSDLTLDRHDLLGIVRDITVSPHPLPSRADPSGVNAMDTARLSALGWRPGGWPLLQRTVRRMLAD